MQSERAKFSSRRDFTSYGRGDICTLELITKFIGARNEYLNWSDKMIREKFLLLMRLWEDYAMNIIECHVKFLFKLDSHWIAFKLMAKSWRKSCEHLVVNLVKIEANKNPLTEFNGKFKIKFKFQLKFKSFINNWK